MKKTVKTAAVLLLSAVMAISFCACGTGSTAGADILTVGTVMEIFTANRSEYNYDVLSGTLSELSPVWQDGDGEYHPLLCDYATEDSKTWTFTVREGMKWHDGEDVKASDIKFTLEYLDYINGEGYASRYEAINVLDEKTVELVLPKANPRELANLVTIRVMPEHIFSGVEDYTSVPNEQANIGCGPYRYVRFDSDAGIIEFEAVKDYPDGEPYAQKVIIRLFDSEDTMYMALKAGEIDMVYKYSGGVSAAVAEDLKASDGITVDSIANTANSAVLIFNNSAAPFDDINVRKAVMYAVDYERFASTFGSEYAVVPNAGFIPEGTFGYVETPVLGRDLEKAGQLLAEAGYTDTDGDGYVDRDGEALTFNVKVRSDKPAHSRYAEMLVNNLAEAGIKVTFDVEEVANFRTVTEQTMEYQAVITGLTPFGMAKNQGMSSLYMWSGNSMGYARITDPAYQSIMDMADDAATLDSYRQAAEAFQNYYAQNIPAVAFFWDRHIQAYSDDLDGFVTDATFGIMNVQSWLSLRTAE